MTLRYTGNAFVAVILVLDPIKTPKSSVPLHLAKLFSHLLNPCYYLTTDP